MFGAFGPAYCECGPNADWFVEEWFSDCIYTTWELVAFWIGMSSVLFWIVAQLPQFISNLKNQTAEALSPWFLLQWLAGDSFNLLGCIFTGDQLATQTFTAIYFILADCIIITQYVYYSMRENERVACKEKDQGSSSLARDSVAEFQDSLDVTSLEFWKRLPKINVVVRGLSEDLEVGHEAPHEAHRYRMVTSVTGCSAASIISHAMHSPKSLCSPHVEHANKSDQNSASASIAHSPEGGRPNGNKCFQPSPNAQYHPDSNVTGPSAASMIAPVLHSPEVPLNSHVDHINRASQTSTATPSASIPERGRLTGAGLRGNPNGQCQTSRTSIGRVEALSGIADRRTGQFQSLKERTGQNIMSAAGLGTIPEITVEQLFPSANAMKHHLRRLVNQYGLECSPPSVSRLRIHHVKFLEKHEVGKEVGGTLTSKFGSGLKKRPVKAAVCLASLVIVGTSTNFFQKSGTLGPFQVKIGRKLLLFCGDELRPWWLRRFGNCLGWGSSAFYFGSRFSQIAMNYQRRSAEGLSLAMLGCAILANTCMGVSILMRTKSLEDLVNKAPWLVGSMGTVSLDLLILLQAKYLDARCTKSAKTLPDERTYLLA